MDERDSQRLDRLEAAVERIEAVLCRLERGESEWQREQAKRTEEIAKVWRRCEADVEMFDKQLQKFMLIQQTAETMRPGTAAAASEPPKFDPKEHVPTLRPVLDEAEGGAP
jgi:hypothetical protein